MWGGCARVCTCVYASRACVCVCDSVSQDHLAQVEAATGVKMIHKDSGSLTLTGWTALAGIAALIILIIWGAG